MTKAPAIVVLAHKRISTLKRLLFSLSNAKYTSSVHLVISVDKSEVDNVKEVANNFKWEFGSKEVIEHSEHLGLKNHVLYCGALSKKFGAVIVLEDDLLVSPYFYEYTVHAVDFYQSDDSVAGISLYNYRITESNFNPFNALDDGSDVYFMQVASSWGQLWTKTQWILFEDWLSANPELKQTPLLPEYVFKWGAHSWKKHYLNYLVETNRFLVFPRQSLTTNFDEPGTNSSGKGLFQSNLQTAKIDFRFTHFSDSLSVYDAWFELSIQSFKMRAPHLNEIDFCVDLYGTKHEGNSEATFWLTSKDGNNSLKSFSSLLFPLETNVLQSLEGNKINLFNRIDIDFKSKKNVADNLLEKKNKELFPTISIIIICKENNIEDFKRTLDSILIQDYKNYEVIVVASSENQRLLKNFTKEMYFIKYVDIESNEINGMLYSGFQNSDSDLLTWLNQGSVLAAQALFHVSNIFKLNASINWICGVDEVYETDEELSKVRTLKYRLTPGEAYKRLGKNQLNTSTENHFFYKNCFQLFNNSKFTEIAFFAHLLLHFQLNVVVLNFGVKKLNDQANKVNAKYRDELINLFSPYHYKSGFSSKLIDMLIRTPFFNDGSWQWYYTSLHNFPQVIRFNKHLSQYYLTKF
jgi:hypothetical protein